MKTKRAYKERFYPTPEQAKLLAQSFGCARFVYNNSDTVDFLLTKKRDKKAATRFFKKAIRLNGMPEKVTIDKSGANTAALEDLNQEQRVAGKPEIQIRQIKYLNNLVEQDHRGIKRRTKPHCSPTLYHTPL